MTDEKSTPAQRDRGPDGPGKESSDGIFSPDGADLLRLLSIPPSLPIVRQLLRAGPFRASSLSGVIRHSGGRVMWSVETSRTGNRTTGIVLWLEKQGKGGETVVKREEWYERSVADALRQIGMALSVAGILDENGEGQDG